MRKLLVVFIILFSVIVSSYANSLWGFSLQERSYFFSNFVDFGVIIAPLAPYSLFVLSPDVNMRFWGGIALNDFPRIGVGYKFYPNLVLNLEYRGNEKYLGILVPFLLEKLQGGVQLNIGVLGSNDLNIEGTFSYPINKVISFGAYIYFPFNKAGKVTIFGRYLWRNFYLTLASDGEAISFSALRYLKF
ncbi:MAG: hypothetical protein ACPLKX_05765 [Dictyoglomaceae bacterium]